MEKLVLHGLNVGYLPQETLDETKTVREIVEEAVADVAGALKRLDAVYAEYAEEGADFALAKEQGELEALIQAKEGHNLENALERAANALRLPEWDTKIKHLSGGERRRVAICRLLLEKPDMFCWMNQPTTLMQNLLWQTLPRRLHRNRGCHHARPLLPRRREQF